MYPTLDEVRKIAASGDYRRIPVSRELYADAFTPVEVLRTLRAAITAICLKAPRKTRNGDATPF